MKVRFFPLYCVAKLTAGHQFISQSLLANILSLVSRIPTAISNAQVLPTVHVVSQMHAPPSHCVLPLLRPVEAASLCTLCKDGQQLAVSRSSGSSVVYYRVVFHGGSCGPWISISPPGAPSLTNLIHRVPPENMLRIASADFSTLLLLPRLHSTLNITVHRHSHQSTCAIRLSSLAAAAAALADYPSGSFLVFHSPLLRGSAEILAQPFRSRVVVHTDRVPLLPGYVSWKLSNDVAIVPQRKLPVCIYEFRTCGHC
jgi:hypothetical protein